MKISRAIGVTAALATALTSFSLTTADAASKRRPLSAPTVGEFVATHGAGAAKRLNPDLTSEEVAELSRDSSARITREGFIFYVEPQRTAPAFPGVRGFPPA